MFSNLTDFGYERTTKEAVGFYIAYFVMLLLVAFGIGALYGISNPDADMSEGLTIGIWVAVITCVALSLLILNAKNLLNNFGLLILIIVAGILAIFLGALGGLIPVAFLTTRSRN